VSKLLDILFFCCVYSACTDRQRTLLFMYVVAPANGAVVSWAGGVIRYYPLVD
jgi:hypothetical protein